MFPIVLRILLMAFAVWIFRRLLMAFQTPKRAGSPKNTNGADKTMVKDPVCGMYMDSRLAIRLENQSEAIFFCSEECRKKFLSKSAGGGMDSAAAGQ
jgi:YHS domain-containing protein